MASDDYDKTQYEVPWGCVGWGSGFAPPRVLTDVDNAKKEIQESPALVFFACIQNEETKKTCRIGQALGWEDSHTLAPRIGLHSLFD
jgi:hypothetical protein